jgi:hypothetical protein
MQFRFAVLAAALLAACYGCATENASQEPAPPRNHTTLTGSRLPPMDDSAGSSSVGSVSKDDYTHDRNSSMSPTR